MTIFFNAVVIGLTFSAMVYAPSVLSGIAFGIATWNWVWVLAIRLGERDT